MAPDQNDFRNDREQGGGPGAADPDRFVFPRWSNWLREASAVAAVGGLVWAVVLVSGVFSPQYSAIGYRPEQPVPYSHALHAGVMNMDCRYCHTTVETTARANIPPTATCMNCHANVRATSEKLELVRRSAETGEAVPWVRIHDLPDFVYFNHAGHVQSGVACVSCHGRVDRMEVVEQVKPLTMGWCLGCHRDPAPNLRPAAFVTDMEWQPDGDPRALGEKLMAENGIAPSTDCTTCHR